MFVEWRMYDTSIVLCLLVYWHGELNNTFTKWDVKPCETRSGFKRLESNLLLPSGWGVVIGRYTSVMGVALREYFQVLDKFFLLGLSLTDLWFKGGPQS